MPPKNRKPNDSPLSLRPDLIGLGPDLIKGVCSFLNVREHTVTREVCKASKEAGDDNGEYWKEKGGSTYGDFLTLWGAVAQLSSSVDGHVEITPSHLVTNSQKRLGSYWRTGEPKPQPYHLSEAVQLQNVGLVRWLSSIERTK